MAQEDPTPENSTSENSTSSRAHRWRRRVRSPGWWIGIVASVVFALAAADYAVEYALARVPLPDEVKLPQSARVYDRHGKLIATYRDEVTRFMIDAGSLPDHVREAVIAAEDRDFYQHEGISFSAMVRAAWENFTARDVTQGGSTITQQYIKNAVLNDPSRTIERKVNEAILAIKLEKRYTKDAILEFYLNTVYFGRGAYGIEAAARSYFAKHANQLTLAESAYLAGLIPAPERYQSGEDAVARRAYVLNAMEEEGYITQAEKERARDAELRKERSAQLRPYTQEAAYFIEWLRKKYLYPRFGDCLFRCGLKIYTTIDMDMQRAAEEAIATNLPDDIDPQAALVSMTQRGEIRALVGGRTGFNKRLKARGFNYATDSRRHAGSAFKPFTLATAIEEDISPHSRFTGYSPKTIDDPWCMTGEEQWIVDNYGGSSYGTLDLVTATSNSVNTVFAELITEVGPDKVAELVEAMGFRNANGGHQIDPVCSLALGTLDVSPLEMARAYATFAARGVRPKVTPIRWVDNATEDCILGYRPPKKKDCRTEVDVDGEQVMDPNSADVLTEALTGVIEGGTATGAFIGRPAAGKTGTAQDNRDAWFAGYVPQLATVVWMGYPVENGPDGKFGTADDVSPVMQYCGLPHCRPVHGISVTGGSFPATIWSQFMLAALDGVEVRYFTAPTYQPTTVINPPPPPKEKKDKDKGDDDEGRGNGPPWGNDSGGND